MPFLTKIECKGFKSFAHPTSVQFSDGLIVIVGPNGSGKSNINDAVKWVLGETKRKTLRAKNSKDIIFAGNESEPPADVAEVTLVFNNEDRVLDIDYSVLEITRRAYRNEDFNEYFINKTKVRRKDIKNLFLGTGLGNTDLSIISQGAISKIAEANPKELRELLNEAAGVSRYQMQKMESVKKLDSTHQDLQLFEVKLSELEKQVKPLKKSAERAIRHTQLKEKLSKIELPIIQKLLGKGINRKEELKKLLIDLEVSIRDLNLKIEDDNSSRKIVQEQIINIDEKNYDVQKQLATLIEKKQKTEIKSDSNLEKEINEINHTLIELKEIREVANNEEEDLNVQINDKSEELNRVIGERNQQSEYLVKISERLKFFNLTAGGRSNRAVDTIIENKNIFNTIYGTVGELVNYSREYEKAIVAAIGNKFHHIAVNNEETIKEAISFLKKNKLGQATFLPIEKVKEKYILEEYISSLRKISGFIETMDILIKGDKKFHRLIKSISGNILVFKDINYALKGARITGYKFTIVTLEGDIIFPGFAVKGGYISSSRGSQESERLLNAKEITNDKLEKLNKQRNDIASHIEATRNSFKLKQSEVIRADERIKNKNENLSILLANFEEKFGKSFVFKEGDFKTQKNLSVEQLKNLADKFHEEKKQLFDDNQKLENRILDANELWKNQIKQQKDFEIEFDQLRKLINDNINVLNVDYKMTWEYLSELKIDKLSISLEEADIKRSKYRRELEDIGYVDIDAIEKYETLNRDYESLKENTNDLKESREKLLSTISSLDEKMREKFLIVFKQINAELENTFSQLFKGGKAELVFENPEDILLSGIEIIAKAPGKVVKNLALFSGGEKSLISLSLIFAINLVRNLPLLLLDEVEAALDEANVERFANFAKNLNHTTQLIIVTHRPGTMEKADILYGVTMQTKGITSIVSVKLNEAKEFAE